MEVVVPMAPTSPQHFHFGGAGTASYATAPSSPRPFGNPEEYYYCYNSAPTSPARAAKVYSYLARDIDDWEEEEATPVVMTPKFGFSLGVGGQLQELRTADELFDKGQIRPLKPPAPPAPPRLDQLLPPKSPKQRGKEEEETRTKDQAVVEERGRERRDLSSPASNASLRRSRREYSRSLSPPMALRGGGGGGGGQVFHNKNTPTSSPSTSTATVVKSRKWRLKDLLLFRSASEGRATGRGSKDPLRKYTRVLLSSSFNKSRPAGDQGSSSIKSSSSSGSINKRGGGGSSSSSSSAGPWVSAHELHYTANRAASEEMKKKTPLPFHQNGLFGCLHFNPAVRSITRGFNTTNSFNRQW